MGLFAGRKDVRLLPQLVLIHPAQSFRPGSDTVRRYTGTQFRSVKQERGRDARSVMMASKIPPVRHGCCCLIMVRANVSREIGMSAYCHVEYSLQGFASE